MIEKYEEGTTEILVIPVCCDSTGRCYGIQWKPLKIEKYMPQEYSVEEEISIEDLIIEQKEKVIGSGEKEERIALELHK